MVHMALLKELRQLYDLRLQAARQSRWGMEKQLDYLCMTILDEIVPDALDSLYGSAVPGLDPAPLEESHVTVPHE